VTSGLGRRRYAIAVAGALLIPLALALIVGLWGAHWYSTGDQALEVLRIHDVGTAHTPLVGVPSRFGWNHPGPLLFWVLAPFYRLFGETGILAGMAVVNLVALAAAIWLAARVGGRTLAALVALACGVLVHALTLSLLVDPWNPWAAVLPFVVCVLAGVAVALGDMVALPILVASGSFALQAHVGYAPVVLIVVIASGLARAAHLVQRRRRAVRAGPLSRGAKRLLILSLALLVVLWLPPVIQQFTGHPGNFTELARYFSDPHEAAAGWTAAAGIAARQLAPLGPWISGRETDPSGLLASAAIAPAMAFVLIVAVLAGLARRAGARRPAAFTAFVVVLDLAGIVATSRVTGLLAGYLVRWWWPLAMFTAIAGAWSLTTIAAPLLRRVRQPALAVGCAAVLAAAVVAAVAGSPLSVPVAGASATTARLVGDVASKLDPSGTYVVKSVDTVGFGAVAVGVTTQLMLEGHDVAAQPDLAQAYGSWRVRRADQATGTIYVVNVENQLAGWTPPVGAEVIAHVDPLTPEERDEAVAIEQRIRAAVGSFFRGQALILGGSFGSDLVDHGASRSDVDRLAQLQQPGFAYFVYLAGGARHG
jgi:hypothetical protein